MPQNFPIPSIDTIPSVASLNLGGARKQNQNCCEPTNQSLLDWIWLKSKRMPCVSVVTLSHQDTLWVCHCRTSCEFPQIAKPEESVVLLQCWCTVLAFQNEMMGRTTRYNQAANSFIDPSCTTTEVLKSILLNAKFFSSLVRDWFLLQS